MHDTALLRYQKKDWNNAKLSFMRYTIPEGKHRSGLYFSPFLNKKRIEGSFLFHKNCLYYPEYSQDINKLVGFSFLYHRFESTRIGWRVYDASPYNKASAAYSLRNLGINQIELFLYTYYNGNMEFKQLGLVYPNRQYQFLLTPGATRIYGNNVEYISAIHDPFANPFFGYMLFPYFGGDLPAPHKMDIDLEYNLK